MTECDLLEIYKTKISNRVNIVQKCTKGIKNPGTILQR